MLHLSLCCTSSSCCTSMCCTMFHPSSLCCISSCFTNHDCTHHCTVALFWALHYTMLHPNACCNTFLLLQYVHHYHVVPLLHQCQKTLIYTMLHYHYYCLHYAALSLLLCALCCTVHHAMHCFSYVHYATLYNMYSLFLLCALCFTVRVQLLLWLCSA